MGRPTNEDIESGRFWGAVRTRDYKFVRKAIANGFDVNARIPGLVEPIVHAQRSPDMKMLRILWEAGAKPVTPWLEQVFADFASGGNGSKYKPKKARQVGKIVLHRYNGDEEFALGPASLRVAQDDGQSWLQLDAQTNGTVIKNLPDTRELRGHPHARLLTTIPVIDPKKFTGHKLSVPDAYDLSIDDWVTNFYYFEHDGLEKNEVTFLSRRKNKYLIKWTGVTIDITHGSDKPHMQVEIEGWFTINIADNAS